MRISKGMTSTKNMKNTNGLSLIECLLTLLITGILASMALPGFQSLIERSRVHLAVSEFHAAILMARTEAIRRGQRIDLVPWQAGDWRHGWVVLIDENNNQRADPGEILIHHSSAELSGLPGLKVDAKLRDAKRAYLAFDPQGRPRSASSSHVPQIGSLVFSVGAARRKLIISFLGRVRLCDPDQEAAAC